ncbi:MAG: ABC transporter ATP-binding protein [Pseudobutyrivibrio sp.]|nr:ABC transporter ATP-binding protein [Pseudobutyrivibrio sp.]
MYSLCVNGIKKHYGGYPVIDDISFEFKPGKVYGLMGENGAGKTTIMKILCGLVNADSGYVSGNNVCIGTLIEDASAYENLTARENLTIFSNYLKNSTLIRIEDLLNLVGIEDNKKKFKDFSIGMKKRLGIAIALLNNPDVLILDEPSCGLDISGIMEIRTIIREFMHSDSRIVIISSHDTRDLVELCDEIIMIHKGRIQEVIKHIDKDSLKLEKKYLQVIEE